MSSNKLEPQIWVGCLTSYNNGELHGEWIDANQSPDDILEQIKTEVIETSKYKDAEEWDIFDYDDLPGDIHDLDEISEMSSIIAAHGELAYQVLDHFCGDIEHAETMLNEEYVGEFRSELEFAEEYFNDIHMPEIPESMSYYIDYDKFARDLFMSDFISIEFNGELHVFRNS